MQPRQVRNWLLTEVIGKGGQGTAYKCFDTNKFDLYGKIIPDLESSINFMGHPNSGSRLRENYIPFAEKLIRQLNQIIDSQIYDDNYVVKEFHSLTESKNPGAVDQRFRQEVEALNKISHPNLLKLIDYDIDQRWYACKYYKNKTLIENKARFKGNILESLTSFRGIVCGVAELHKNGFVHRDIKPHNVFVSDSNNLILGDFGLVFFRDTEKTRVTDTLENVGSWNWMPEWATNKRLEDTNFSFDVYSLGKLLWSMLTGEEYLRLWYFSDDEYNVSKKFPGDSAMVFANEIFRRCIVEREPNCLKNATELLELVDEILGALKSNGAVMIDSWDKKCKFCDVGTCQLAVGDEEYGGLRNLGLNAISGNHYKIYECNYCGHMEIFHYSNNNVPTVWDKLK